MSENQIKAAARTVLSAHGGDDVPATAAAGVVLARMVLEEVKQTPALPPRTFAFEMEDDKTDDPK